jgi:hypothetical protein
MHTVKLRISDTVFEKFMWFLSKFKKSEIEIINEDEEMTKIKKYLDTELKEMAAGNAKFIELDEFESNLNEGIIKV